MKKGRECSIKIRREPSLPRVGRSQIGHALLHKHRSGKGEGDGRSIAHRMRILRASLSRFCLGLSQGTEKICQKESNQGQGANLFKKGGTKSISYLTIKRSRC